MNTKEFARVGRGKRGVMKKLQDEMKSIRH